jgi:hypothetical protein
MQGKFETVQRQGLEEEELMQGKFETVQRQGLEEEELMQGKFETVQRQGPEEEELLQGKFETAQRQGPEEEELMQGKFETVQKGGEGETLQSKSAVAQKKGSQTLNNTGLPDTLKLGIENLSGLSMDDVKVHYNSTKPAQLQAHAFAQGTDIHMAPGQEKHLPHEAWHVVQQKQGRVKPTKQMKGKVNVNDDVGLEHEADVMGAQASASAVQLAQLTALPSERRGEPLKQGAVDGRESQSARPAPAADLANTSYRHGSPAMTVVQREPVPVSGGVFEDTRYKPVGEKGEHGWTVGAEMGMLKFTPLRHLAAEEVHIVQITKEVHSDEGQGKEKVKQGNVGYEDRVVKNGPNKGWAVDVDLYGEGDRHMANVKNARAETMHREPDNQLGGQSNEQYQGRLTSRDPRYAQQRVDPETPAYTPEKPPKVMTTGYGTKKDPKTGGWKPNHAGLRDRPSVPSSTSIVGMDFEASVVATGGSMDGTHLGSVLWGWSRQPGGKEAKVAPMKKGVLGGASEKMVAAAKVWNEMKVDDEKLFPLSVEQHEEDLPVLIDDVEELEEQEKEVESQAPSVQQSLEDLAASKLKGKSGIGQIFVKGRIEKILAGNYSEAEKRNMIKELQ